MRINTLESLVSMSVPPPQTQHPPPAPPSSLPSSSSSPTAVSLPPPSRFSTTSPPGAPQLEPLIILGIFPIIFIAAYALHVFLWTYFPPDTIIPNEIDTDIIVGAADRRRRQRVRRRRRLQWGVGSSSSNSNDPTREEGEEEENGQEGERYELDELRKSSVEEKGGATPPA